MSIEAMKMALEALQKIYIAPEHEEYIRVWWPACEEAIPALREAIAEAEQAQPVAWWIPKAEQFCLAKKDGSRPFARAWEPLYTAPPPRQSLTDEVVKLRGEMGVLVGLLGAALQVIETVDGDDADECQMLMELQNKITYAIQGAST